MLKNQLRKIKHCVDRILLSREVNRARASGIEDSILPQIVDRFSTSTILEQAKHADSNLEIPKASCPLSIVIFTQPPGAVRTTIVEATIAKLLIERGHHVKVILCDKNQPGCDLIRVEHVHRKDQICSKLSLIHI